MNQFKMQSQQVVVLAICLLALVACGAAQLSEDEGGEFDEILGGGGKGVHKGVGHKVGHGVGHLNKAEHVGGGGLGGNGLGGLIGAMGGRLGDFGHKSSAPLSSARLEGASATGSGSVVGAPPSATAAAVVHKEEEKHGLFGHHFHKFFELLLKPAEFIKAIAEHFALPLKEFFELVVKGLVFGVEVLLSPILVTIKIIEKVFVPDTCRLKFMCHIGTHLDALREHALKFSPKFIETSVHLKAFTDGIVGRDCESTFIACEPKLKEPFEKLKTGVRGLSEVQGIASPAAGTESAAATEVVTASS